MKEIIVTEASLVPPSTETPSQTLRFSNLDLLVPKYHVPTVYFYTVPCFFEPRNLKSALANILVPFYPFAGRLKHDENNRDVLLCNGEGVLFVTANANFSLADFGDLTPGNNFKELIPSVHETRHKISPPLVLIQFTLFKCGGICLGVGLHHTLADGASAIQFINAWSDVARGSKVKVMPFVDRSILRARDPPVPSFKHVEYDHRYDPPLLPLKAPTTVGHFKITSDQIFALKRKIDEEQNGETRYSTYETITGHIWRCACRARCIAPNEKTKVYMVTDGRSRLRPPLPPGYIGNVLFACMAAGSGGEVMSLPLSETMGRIRSAIARMDDEYLRSALEYLELQEDLDRLVRGAATFASPNLNVVSWTHLPVHEADFGWGKPSFMGPASVVFEGMAYVIRNAKEKRSLDVFICLESECMETFRKLFYDNL